MHFSIKFTRVKYFSIIKTHVYKSISLVLLNVPLMYTLKMNHLQVCTCCLLLSLGNREGSQKPLWKQKGAGASDFCMSKCFQFIP